MEKFIAKEKLSKKARRALNLKKRHTWGAITPITKKAETPKAYNRKKVQQGDDFFHQSVELFLPRSPFRYYPVYLYALKMARIRFNAS